MGIDVYLKWDGMTEEDEENRITGFEVSKRAGASGYLREAYHGEPYATFILFPECFEGNREHKYNTNTLIHRSAQAIIAANKRGETIYKRKEGDPEMEDAIKEFIKLHGKKEREGLNPKVYVSY